MKKMILVLSIASTFVACGNNGEKTAGVQTEPTLVTIPPPPVTVKKEVRYVDRPQAAAPAQPQKKGWSKAAKGTAIGVGVGAVTGAIVSKNKVKGAVIGGVIGGGTGYVIGRSKDRKDGRVKK